MLLKLQKLIVVGALVGCLIWTVVYIAGNIGSMSAQLDNLQAIFHALAVPRVI